MYVATLTYRDPFDMVHTSTVSHERQDMFYATVTGAVQGIIGDGRVLLALETSEV